MGAVGHVREVVIANATRRIAEMGRQYRFCTDEMKMKDAVIETQALQLRDQSTMIGDMQSAIIGVSNRNAALQTWATIGKVGTIAVAVGAGVVVVVAVRNAMM